MGTGYDNPTTRIRTTYDFLHELVRNSSAWYVEDNSTLTVAAVRYIVISTATVGSASSDVQNVRPYGIFTIDTTGAYTAELYEACEASTCTELNAINLNRESTVTHGHTFQYCSSVTLGTKIQTLRGATADSPLSTKEGSPIFYLKYNTKYILRITSLAAANNVTVGYTFVNVDGMDT